MKLKQFFLLAALGLTASATLTSCEDILGHWEKPTPVTPTPSGSEEESVPGLLTGKFTINAEGKKVRFSQGNLQATYDGSEWTWKFAEHQWDYIGNAEGNTKVSGTAPFVAGYTGTSTTVDLFGWVGASNTTWTGAAMYGITNSTTSTDYGNGTSDALKSDWGTLAITNGGNTENFGWHTLTGGDDGEWKYLLSTRTTGGTVFGTAQARYAHATINTDIASGVNGIILFPDGVDIADSEVTTAGTVNGNSVWGTKCTSAEWTALEAKGCVFLPAAGSRGGDSVYTVGSDGGYWSSTADGAGSAYGVYFFSSSMAPGDGNYNYNVGFSVRLVRPVE